MSVSLVDMSAGDSTRFGREFDLLIVACGYEQRCIHIACGDSFAAKDKLALAFPRNQLASFAANAQALVAAGFTCVQVEDGDVYRTVVGAIREVIGREETEPHVCVDISSLSRPRIASVLAALEACATDAVIHCRFIYSEGLYTEPSVSSAGPYIVSPVSQELSGLAADPERPIALILGVGYEMDRAFGALEFFEVAEAWALQPRSAEAAYEADLTRANSQLFEKLGASRVLRYDVEQPRATYALLRALVAQHVRRNRVVLVPSGPKILALLAMLLAMVETDLAVWRIASVHDEAPVDRLATGRVLVVDVDFGASTSLPVGELLIPR